MRVPLVYLPCCPVPNCLSKRGDLSGICLPNLTVRFILSPSSDPPLANLARRATWPCEDRSHRRRPCRQVFSGHSLFTTERGLLMLFGVLHISGRSRFCFSVFCFFCLPFQIQTGPKFRTCLFLAGKIRMLRDVDSIVFISIN